MNKDSIANYITHVGSGFDPTSAGRPSLDDRLTDFELNVLFMENDIARRVVEEIVDDSLRSGLPAMEYSNSDEAVKLDLEEIQEIKDKIREAAINGRIQGGGHILLIVDDGKKLSEPLEWEELPHLINTFTLTKQEVTPCMWGERADQPRFQEPTHYMVTPTGSGAGTQTFPRVHYTRFLPFRGNRLPRELRRANDYYDDSVLQAVWTPVSNFVQSEKSIVNIINRFETATFHIAGLSAAQGDEESMQMIQERMELAHKSLSILNAMMVDADANEAYERRFATVTGLDTLWDRLATSVAKAAKMAKSQLFGEGNSGIRGEDEVGGRGWRKQVEEYRNEELLLNIIKLVSLMKGRRVVPLRDKNNEVIWGNVDSPKPVDQARIDQMASQRIATLLEHGVIGSAEARTLLAGKSVDWDAPPPHPPEPEEQEPEEGIDETPGI